MKKKRIVASRLMKVVALKENWVGVVLPKGVACGIASLWRIHCPAPLYPRYDSCTPIYNMPHELECERHAIAITLPVPKYTGQAC